MLLWIQQKTSLKKVNNKVIIRYKKAVDRTQKKGILLKRGNDAKLDWKDDRTVIITRVNGEAQDFLQSTIDDPTIATATPVYADESGLEIGITDEILIGFLPNVSTRGFPCPTATVEANKKYRRGIEFASCSSR